MHHILDFQEIFYYDLHSANKFIARLTELLRAESIKGDPEAAAEIRKEILEAEEFVKKKKAATEETAKGGDVGI